MSEAKCDWCGSENIAIGTDRVFWELPDGTKAIEITETPTIFCQSCRQSYQQDNIVKAIEDQLFLINTKNIEKTISYNKLLLLPRLLKKNYFDFS
jgi:uncharacterized YokU family protein